MSAYTSKQTLSDTGEIPAGELMNDVPTAGGGISRAAYLLVSQAQVPVEPLLRRANLSTTELKNPRVRIPVKDQIKFLNLVADELRDEFIGIRLARTVELRELGLLYYVMASSPLAMLCAESHDTARSIMKECSSAIGQVNL